MLEKGARQIIGVDLLGANSRLFGDIDCQRACQPYFHQDVARRDGDNPRSKKQNLVFLFVFFSVSHVTRLVDICRVSYGRTRVNALVNARQPNLISLVCTSGSNCSSFSKMVGNMYSYFEKYSDGKNI